MKLISDLRFIEQDGKMILQVKHVEQSIVKAKCSDWEPVEVAHIPKSANVGENIKTLRMAKGLTSKKLADLIGISKSYMSEIENGSRKGFSVGAALNIARALGTTVEELHGQTEDQEILEKVNERLSDGESPVEVELKDL